MIYLIIGLFLIAVGSTIVLTISGEKALFAYVSIVLYFVGIILCIVGLGRIIHSHPQAIDVYRGKTTLQITYKDSIPVDSVVVFK